MTDPIKAKIQRRGKDPRNSPCWNWPGYTIGGYGIRKQRGKRYLVHRRIYEALVGAIPTDMQIDHLCRNKKCQNPFHLEAVTCRTNVLRGEGPTARHARKIYCDKGHELSGTNLYSRPKGGRACKKCRKEAQRKFNNK